MPLGYIYIESLLLHYLRVVSNPFLVMIKFAISVLLTIVASSICDGQNAGFNEIKFPKGLRSKAPFQFSSIIVTDDNILMAAEKCGKLIVLSKESDSFIEETIPVPYADKAPDGKICSIEGMAFYKQHLLLLDENNQAVYAFNTTSKKFNVIGTKELFWFGAKYPCNTNGKKSTEEHLEGITIDEQNSLCYVLHETGNGIFVFDIDPNTLRLKKKRFLCFDQGNWTRSTDIHYEDGKLYILRTDFEKTRPDSANYQIDVFRLSDSSTILEHIDQLDLKGFPHKNNKTYSSNLEGMTKKGELFYIVSDNAESNSKNCETESELNTNFFSVKKESVRQ